MRYEQLLGECAGDESLFADRRRESAVHDRLGQLATEAKKAALPQRPKLEEPGSIVVPAYRLEWLKTSCDGSWTIGDSGMLDAIRLMFANLDASLINGVRFEKAPDGAGVLITPEDVVFRPDANPHAQQGGPGHVNPAIALATLRRNGFIAVERTGNCFRIRLGDRSEIDHLKPVTPGLWAVPTSEQVRQ